MYQPPTVTVDGVIFRFKDSRLQVLLINRAAGPFKGEPALPGGYVAEGMTTEEALDNTLQRKTGLKIGQLSYLEQLYTFDMVARDPRGHAVSVAYLGSVLNAEPKAKAGTESPGFMNIDELPPLAFDHKSIIGYARQRLQSKLTYTNVAAAFLPARFTLTELQSVYESILGRELDKRNFRKQIKAQNLVKETDEWAKSGRHRPARLYSFTSRKIGAFEF